MLSSDRAGAFALGAALLAVTVFAWRGVLWADEMMRMGHAPGPPSLMAGSSFVWQWGVMMTAMMLPSAAPMLFLYRAMRSRPDASRGRALPAAVFALVYLLIWLSTGVPVYAASVVVESVAARSPAFTSAIPYLIAATLFAAGVYQLTPAKRACLRQCESPMNFLMTRWRDGNSASFQLAVKHALYCIGCCWALMVVLVVAGAMSLPWVLAIALLVFAEKILPGGQRTAVIIAVLLMFGALVVAARPGVLS